MHCGGDDVSGRMAGGGRAEGTHPQNERGGRARGVEMPRASSSLFSCVKKFWKPPAIRSTQWITCTSHSLGQATVYESRTPQRCASHGGHNHLIAPRVISTQRGVEADCFVHCGLGGVWDINVNHGSCICQLCSGECYPHPILRQH
jgi:hypothetical protein